MSSKQIKIIGALTFLALSFLYGAYIFRIKLFVVPGKSFFTARTMPMALCFLGVLISLLYLTTAFIGSSSTAGDRQEKTEPVVLNWRPTLLFFALMVFYGIALRWIGFVAATIVFLVCGARILGERNIKKTLIVSSSVVLVFWLLIGQVMDIYLSNGDLWSLLF